MTLKDWVGTSNDEFLVYCIPRHILIGVSITLCYQMIVDKTSRLCHEKLSVIHYKQVCGIVVYIIARAPFYKTSDWIGIVPIKIKGVILFNNHIERVPRIVAHIPVTIKDKVSAYIFKTSFESNV